MGPSQIATGFGYVSSNVQYLNGRKPCPGRPAAGNLV